MPRHTTYSGYISQLHRQDIFFQIPIAVVSPLITSILFFDIVLFLAQWSTESAKFLRYQEELLREMKIAKGLELDLINKQIGILHDKWDVESAYYKINILAAAFIIIGFGVSLLCSGPLILASLALLSSLGNALYNTTDEFKKYQQTHIAFEREKSKGLTNDINQLVIDNLNEEYRTACFDFWKSLALTTVGTAFIITVAAFSWPVALCLTLGYIAYRFNSHFQKEQGNNLKFLDQENYHSLCMT